MSTITPVLVTASLAAGGFKAYLQRGSYLVVVPNQPGRGFPTRGEAEAHVVKTMATPEKAANWIAKNTKGGIHKDEAERKAMSIVEIPASAWGAAANQPAPAAAPAPAAQAPAAAMSHNEAVSRAMAGLALLTNPQVPAGTMAAAAKASPAFNPAGFWADKAPAAAPAPSGFGALVAAAEAYVNARSNAEAAMQAAAEAEAARNARWAELSRLAGGDGDAALVLKVVGAVELAPAAAPDAPAALAEVPPPPASGVLRMAGAESAYQVRRQLEELAAKQQELFAALGFPAAAPAAPAPAPAPTKRGKR